MKIYVINLQSLYRFSITLLLFIIMNTVVVNAADNTHLFSFPSSNTQDFNVTVTQQRGAVEILNVHWDIAPGLQLYRNKIHFSINPDTVKFGPIDMPLGSYNNDSVLGNYQVYQHTVDIQIPVHNPQGLPYSLTVEYQGCQPGRYCYPPQIKTFQFNSQAAAKIITQPTTDLTSPNSLNNQPQMTSGFFTAPSLNTISALFSEHNFGLILLSFFGFGILLSLTPCILPMLPILMGIILGQKNNTTRNAFFLSLSYVLGVAVSYAIAGVVAASLGQSLQAMLQNPWVISVFSLVFILLALSLFGAYDLQVPAVIRNRLHNTNQKIKGGSYLSAAMMGVVSSLVASPCLTAPLAGALIYLSSTGNQLLGGSALFALGLGLGVPMLILGASGGKLMLKAGSWMNQIKTLLGLILIAMAIWMISRILSNAVMSLIWGLFLVISPIALGTLEAAHTLWQRLIKALGVIVIILGAGLMLKTLLPKNELSLNQDYSITKVNQQPHYDLFTTVYTKEQLNSALAQAKNESKPVMLDYYADWCTACKELGATTFSDPQVIEALKGFVLIRADITKNDEQARQLQHVFHVFGPPTLQFFNAKGHAVQHAESIGYISAKNLITKINQVKK
ncbi:protein-disulfide reductase DsbD [Piscirickettsia litoralis]|uniref:Thioredoxin domain-containing protein n=1 Tax=Piscirickettsia litoralis TaxID=1891921 RepID=A0ABX2ZZ22_9GAMM|nr:protein-disulfide reductase DsbD [Piscirickettsia litoralis]ODN41862.1 hypothetical protein BGC07_01345 [Piscirickettsia litoralis]